MTDLRCVIFDVDGTLVDSQADIVASMNAAFAAVDLPAPPRADILSHVGLSLGLIFPRMVPDLDATAHRAMEAAYKDRYAALRAAGGASGGAPLYPGAAEALSRLSAQPETLLALATGKSNRGLDHLIEAHGWHGLFVSRQSADDHPSKPHPSMIAQVLRDTGVDARRAVMVGDTSYDMDMARAAGIRAVGVAWGYHPAHNLQADARVESFDALPAAIDDLLEDAA
ncbi:phosphoglycolate phosphatase [Palleronia salina]|uniref:Phosphoglycolate phosphatase n=1 Tax=Palleronia salina TaxID=313368 RepID=A0A1M6GQC5_9RHOB|nr:HAD-IA family hydrolase [Palleronia salina]SHJ12149.1 phosphoglycolate phosphatase [Palleronia salina]